MDASSYQQFRLWAGICSIGINLGLVWAAYLATHWVPGLTGATEVWFLPFFAFTFALIAILAFLPFEVLIGFAGESAFSRSQQSFSEWLQDWSRSQWLVLAGVVAGICIFGWVGPQGLLWHLAAVVALSVVAAGFVFTLPFWIRFLGGFAVENDRRLESQVNEVLKSHDAPPVRLAIVDDGDEEGVNGTILPFDSETFTINRAASEQLEAEELASLVLREQWFHRNGQAGLCLGIVLGWLSAGILLSFWIPGALLGAESALQSGIGGTAVMTTWCFLALLTWPPLNNRIMLRADASMAEKIGVDETVALLNKIQTLNESDFDLSESKEHVFHPIPSLKKRLEHLKVY